MEKSKIQWTDATWNPFYGCRKVSAECKFCYMYRDFARYGRNPKVVTKGKTTFNKPLSWKEPKLIFTCSWSDWFIEEADEWRLELWKIIKLTPWHTYQILSKRPERILQCLPPDWGEGYDNVWLGVSVGNNESLHRCKTLGAIPAKVKFISAEPLLEDITGLNDVLKQYKFDWCIIGAESGNSVGKHRFRKCDIRWIENIINSCQNNNVKVFVKQLGTFLAKQMQLKDSHGGNMDEWPTDIQRREFPKSYRRILNQKTIEEVKIKKVNRPKLIESNASSEFTVNGKPIPKMVSKSIMPINEYFLTEKPSSFKIDLKEIDYNQVGKLPPFKALLAKSIIAGEDPKELATRISIERNIPRPTAQAYVTMVQKMLLKMSSVGEI